LGERRLGIGGHFPIRLGTGFGAGLSGLGLEAFKVPFIRIRFKVIRHY